MKNLFGTIDLTVLGTLVRKQPSLVKKVTYKDGTEHQLLDIEVHSKKEEDQWGNVAFIKATCRKEKQIDGVKYYLSNLKISKFQDEQANAAPSVVYPEKQQAAPAAAAEPQQEQDLPF